MVFLKHLFSTPLDKAKEATLDEEQSRSLFDENKEITRKKIDIVLAWKKTEIIRQTISELQELLLRQLHNLEIEEKDEKELTSDLESVRHDKRIRRLHKIDHCLRVADTTHEYVYELLTQLYKILATQLNIVNQLIRKNQYTAKLIAHLRQQLELEVIIENKISESFYQYFTQVVNNVSLVLRLNADEKILLAQLEREFQGSFSNKIKGGLIDDWAQEVLYRVEEITDLENADGIDYLVVNRPEFVDIVRAVLTELIGVGAYIVEYDINQLVNVFAYRFRQWFNYERKNRSV
ncbi:MAG: hypothetical protein V1859_01445 [archaeon]